MFNAAKIIQNNTLKGFIVHVALAILSLISNVFVIGFVYVSIFFFLKDYSKANNNHFRRLVVLKSLLYLGSFEMICRILHCDPFIPYEFSKYLFSIVLLMVVINLRVNQKSSILPIVILLISVAFSFIMNENKSQFGNVVFNILGPFNVALFLLVYNRFEITDVWPLLNAILYPLIVVWVYCFFRTPDFESLSLTRNASDALTGGFGSNQVSTALGLAVFVIFLFIFSGRNFSGYFYLDLIVLVGISVQGLLSLSRGGMMGGVLAIVLFILGNLTSKSINGNKTRSFFFVSILILSFWGVDKYTSGLVLDRYLGKTEGVLAGTKELNLNNVTTGRFNIFNEDLEIWYNNFLVGAGIGNSMYLHSTGALAHSELSRLLGEQGLIGGLFFLVWVYLCFNNYRHQPTLFGKIFVLACATLAFFTTFHAAMRTFVTPVLTVLAILIYTKKNN
jgi:hypothetical protein